MKFFSHGKDGGPESHVDGYWLVELKRLFSIVLLKFRDGSRDAYHSHAFFSLNWVLRGVVIEILPEDNRTVVHRPSLWPILTRRSTFHKVTSVGTTWVFSLRGRWKKKWRESVRGKEVLLTHGRKIA